MILKPYAKEDLPRILALFLETVHAVNAADYTPRQLEAWAPPTPDAEKWSVSLAAHYALLAWEKEKLLGFGDIDESGYLDRLYVAADSLRRGIGRALCEALEEYARTKGVRRVSVCASITAKPFFEKRGYRALRRQAVERRGVLLTNFYMEKIFKTAEKKGAVKCRAEG